LLGDIAKHRKVIGDAAEIRTDQQIGAVSKEGAGDNS
jgi:hypothetical protein